MRSKPNWKEKADKYLRRLSGIPRPIKHYRCGQCSARKTLNRELWQYTRPPKCVSCKGEVDWRLDMARYQEWKERKGPFDTCNCEGLPYPHRKASLVWCVNHPSGPSEAQWEERYGMPEVPAMTFEDKAVNS